MDKRSGGFFFADSNDSAGILNIMESDITPGGLQLLYTRRDDPYASFLEESREAKVGVIKSDGWVIATIAALPRKMYINGTPRRVCYVTNMKRLKDCDINLNWYEMFKEMCKAVDCDLYFCSLLNDNLEVQRMLHKKRRYMPYSEPVCGYKTYIINPGVRMDKKSRYCFKEVSRDNSVEFVRAGRNDEDDIVSFLIENGRNRDLFPVFDRLSDIGDIKAEDFYLLRKEGRIVSAGAVWDRRGVKQYVLKRCSGIYAFLRFLNPILPLLGYIKLPENDKTADCAFISFLMAQDDKQEYLRALLVFICMEAKSRYPMLIIGTDEANAKRPVLESLRSVSFETQLNEIIMTNIDGKTRPGHYRSSPEMECALL